MGLASIRKFRGFSQSQLAEAMNINLMTISRIERGVEYPYGTIFKIAEFLQCAPYEIFRSDDVPFGYDEIIAVHHVALKHIGRPCYFGNTADEVMKNAAKMKNLYLADAREGAMIDTEGTEWRYVMPNRKFKFDNIKSGRRPGTKTSKKEI